MATVKGVNATLRTAVPASNLGPQDQGGRLRVMYDSYSPAGALSLNDVIRLGILPKGARVVGYWLKSSDLGTVGTLDLGWAASDDGTEAADDNGFLSAVDVHTAAITADHGDQENMPGLGKKFDAEVEVQIKASAATDAAGDIEACVYYVID